MDDYDDYDGFDDFMDDEIVLGYLVLGWSATLAADNAFKQSDQEPFRAQLDTVRPGLSVVYPGPEESPRTEIVFGKILKCVSVERGEGPDTVDLSQTNTMLTNTPELTAEEVALIIQAHPDIVSISSHAPQVYLTGNGPLCYSTLFYGEQAAEFPEDLAAHHKKFVATSMRQDRVGGLDCVWGVCVQQADFNDVSVVKLDPASRAQHEADTADLNNPRYILGARYD